MVLNVEFIPKTEDIAVNVPSPKPAKAYSPNWYKSIPKFSNGSFSAIDFPDGSVGANTTVKSCVPFMDALLTGYIQETWCDIYVEETNGFVTYKYSSNPKIVSHRDKPSIQISESHFYNMEFVWHQPWIPKLPKGYSMLYTHPLNRLDLPFVTLDGVIDNDAFSVETAGNYPFFLKTGFTGMIPAGTPMFQMVPIRREAWSSSTGKPFGIKQMGPNRHFYDGYKKMFWTKKEYS